MKSIFVGSLLFVSVNTSVHADVI